MKPRRRIPTPQLDFVEEPTRKIPRLSCADLIEGRDEPQAPRRGFAALWAVIAFGCMGLVAALALVTR